MGQNASVGPSELEWPPVEVGLQCSLQRVFCTPLRLDAAFDDEQQCNDLLVSVSPDLIGEELRDAIAQMMVWKESIERPLKRLRSAMVSDSMFRLPVPSALTVQDEFNRITKTSSLCILEMHSKRRQRKYKEDPADARARRFDSERKKYSLLLAQIFIRADLPVVQLIKTLDDPNSAWIHIFAARRANTLKNRYKIWKPFEQWLEWNRGRTFPEGVKDAIDYIQHRVNDGCGKTIPESLHTTLGLIEQLGRVPEDQRISEDPLWKGHVKSWAAELAEEAAPRKPAEMYTVAMICSLELTVVDEDTMLFARALAWVVLCMIWGALRCDDVQAILPARMLLSNHGLRLVMGRTKTTGPDKVQKEANAYVSRLTSLTGEDWLRAGYNIWTSDLFSFRRDYLVMEPTADWHSVKRKFLPPSGLSSAVTKLLAGLLCPRRVGGAWSLMRPTLLLPDGVEVFFSGHSPRNFLTSVAAAIGFSKDERAYLGRWSMGMVASEEYVRTARQVVYKIQRAVNRALLEGQVEPYYEDEAIEKLCEFSATLGINPNRIKKRHVLLNNLSGRHCLGGIYPALEQHEDDWEEAGIIDPPHELAGQIGAQSARAASLGDGSKKFFITVSRRNALKRLHLSGCYVKPDRCHEVLHLDEVNDGDFDSICLACKKRMLAECGKDQGDQSSSTASSSSTDSEVPEREEPE